MKVDTFNAMRKLRWFNSTNFLVNAVGGDYAVGRLYIDLALETKDEVLFEVYLEFIHTYFTMAAIHARPLLEEKYNGQYALGAGESKKGGEV